MVDPYRMVVISLLASTILSLGIYIYKYIYPKKNIHLLVLLLLISILPIISIFRPGIYESSDFSIHVYRTIAFYTSLAEGILLPSWASGLNATYGYPLFIFNYPLPYYLISFFHFFGFSFILSMKLFLAVNFLLSGIFMYLCSKKIFKNDIAAFTSAIFYQFAPYHLIDLHFKVVIGEILVFTLAPLTFFFLQKMWEKKKMIWFALASISAGLLIMAHVVLALFFMILFFCYAVFVAFQQKNKMIIFTTTIAFIVGSIYSLYVWLTPFFMIKYTIFSKALGSVYFPQIWELLFSPWRLGFLFQGSGGELSFLLGYMHILIIITTIYLLYKNKATKNHKLSILFWTFALGLTIFLISSYSKSLWELVPFLTNTGSFRLLLLAVFISSILAGYVSLHVLKKRFILLLLILLTVFSSILNWGQRRMIPETTDSTFINHLWKSTSESEGHYYANSQFRDPRNPWFSRLPDSHLKIIKGSGEIKELSRSSIKHIYLLDAKTPLVLRENTLYFPGWNIMNNHTAVKISHDKEGIIVFSLPKGLQYIEVTYTDIPIYKRIKQISFYSFLIIVGVICIYIIREYKLLRRFSGNNQ